MTPYGEPIFGLSRERVCTKNYTDLHTVSTNDLMLEDLMKIYEHIA